VAWRPRPAYWISAALLILGAVYASLPWILASWLRHELATQGWTVIRLDMGYPGWRRINVEHAQLRTVSGPRTFHLALQNLELEYRLMELAGGRGRRLHLPEATLLVQSSISSEPPTATPWPLPGTWVAGFPVQEFIIDRLKLEWSPAAGTKAHAHVSGRLRRHAHELTGGLTWADEQQRRAQLSLAMNEAGELRAIAKQPAQSTLTALELEAKLAPTASQKLLFKGSIVARPDRIASLPQPLPVWFDLPPGVSGTIRGHWEGTLDADTQPDWRSLLDTAQLSGRVELELKLPRISDLVRDTELQLDMKLMQEAGRLRFQCADGFRLTGFPDMKAWGLAPASPEDSRPMVISAPKGFSGELLSSKDRVTFRLQRGAHFTIDQLRWADGFIPRLDLGFTGSATVHYLPAKQAWRYERVELVVNAPKVDAVVPLQDLRLETSLSSQPSGIPIIKVDDLTVGLLGGTVTGRAIHYDSMRAGTPSTFQVEGLDIGQVVALEQQEGLEASGRLDGQLPLEITPAGVRVTQGFLRARPPGGVIRYTPDESTRSVMQSNPNLDVVFQALRNLHYGSLEIGVDYLPTGDLKLGLKLAGKNPDWNRGQPINLNINVEENIPKLWQSLRLSDEIRGKIDRKVQEYYKNKK